MTYLGRIFIALDQLGNALADGNPDCTISGRTGYFVNYAHTSVKWYWIALEWIINTTFFPLDGPDHCQYAYHNEEDENYNSTKGALVMFILSFIIIFSCLILIFPFHLLWFFNLVKPKRKFKYLDSK